ncbi:hypothetical protein Tco_0703389 [Tanacetum coccineum]|uniref:Uncharacterized protein n=1 Tax=Tanacetum coccineum TaxID=301880 RepID=A0ABQ4Y0K8_9ASTR
MATSQSSTSRITKKPKITIKPPRKQLFIDLTKDEHKTPSPKNKPQSPHAPIKTPSTRGTSSSSSIPSKLNSSPFYSSSPSNNPYLEISNNSPPPRVFHPSPTYEHQPMNITLSPFLITPLGYTFNTPSPPLPSPPIIGHPVPFNILDAQEATCTKPRYAYADP